MSERKPNKPPCPVTPGYLYFWMGSLGWVPAKSDGVAIECVTSPPIKSEEKDK